jgi:hypothetical protein
MLQNSDVAQTVLQEVDCVKPDKPKEVIAKAQKV